MDLREGSREVTLIMIYTNRMRYSSTTVGPKRASEGHRSVQCIHQLLVKPENSAIDLQLKLITLTGQRII